MPLWADQLLPQLFMEQFDTLPIQCRHIEHMHEGVWFRKNNFWQNDSCENLDNFSLISCLYMHRRCPYLPINSYHSFLWNNLILCLYNVDTFNIYMKKFGLEINIFWQNDSCGNLKVSNGAKIRNRYNQVPHLTQDTNGKVTNSQKTPQTRAKRSALSQQVTTKHI